MVTDSPTRSAPAPAGSTTSSRLPWWALALPTVAFLILLLLILRPTEAHATTTDPAALRGLLDQIGLLFSRLPG